MYQIKGELHLIGETIQVSDKFKKREIVISDKSGQYEQFVSLQLTQDRCSVIDDFKEGDLVEVCFFLRGRKWEGKDGVRYFNSLDAYSIKLYEEKPQEETFVEEDENNPLPF